MKISAVLIVKNEAAIIEACLAKLADFDEIIVLDTGSTDGTIAKASSFKNARVFCDFEWRDDFSAARNHAASKATGDWNLSVDADSQLITSVKTVRAEAKQAEKAGEVTALAKAKHPNGAWHYYGVLFKNGVGVEWRGRVHECLIPGASFKTKIEFDILESPAKAADPDRNLRILLASDLTDSRTLFYIGREFWDRARYNDCIEYMQRYLPISQYWPELADAHLTLARCYWLTMRGDEARRHCLKAIEQNPDFKEALLFAAEVYNPPWREGWLRLAETATNENVLFVRV